MDVHRLIAEIHKRPPLWDVRNGENKVRYCIPNLWKEVARNVGVDVSQCKRKWKNLRDAYRAEVRRSERRIERDKLMGEYDPKTNYTSKWVYFAPMSFINDNKRHLSSVVECDNINLNSNDSNGNDKENDNDDITCVTNFRNICGIKLEPEHGIGIHNLNDNATEEDDDETADDKLFEEFQNIATPQAARRLSATFSLGNSFEQNSLHEPSNAKPTTSPLRDCKCSQSSDDQVHFLEDLGREEQKLIISTRREITRSNKLDHVGDPDYNFLVSFLPQMKKMSELQNLQFRAKMCDSVLNILAPLMSTRTSPVPQSSAETTMALQQQPETSIKQCNGDCKYN